MLTLIIGKESNLSNLLHQKLKHSILLSSRELSLNIDILSKYEDEKINIIFNNFQSSIQLNNLDNSYEYITNSILVTSMVLDYFKDSNINKIIYTSSSSVYGNNILCKETDELQPLSLHASLKIANEKLIEKYCNEHNIDYTVTRIFNMYGGNDKFSIISKIINAVKYNVEITIINNGNAIRDFIHIDDVVEVYMKVLETKVKIINLGTGIGTSIKSLLDFLYGRNITIQTNTISRDELKTSTANNELLKDIIKKDSFIHVEDYLTKELNV